MRNYSKDVFVEKAIKIHGDKYSYENTDYSRGYSKVVINCKIHGDFVQLAQSHLSGRGCPACSKLALSNKLRGTTENFIERSVKIHGDTYDYSSCSYKDSQTKVLLICKTHGGFEQKPYDHLSGCGCPRCQEIGTEEFIESSAQIHQDKYDYSLVKYESCAGKVDIVCKTHGVFKQVAGDHQRGRGCPKCMLSGYSISKPGSFYILSYLDITKVGITNRDATVRLRDIVRSSKKNFKIELFIKFEDGKIPQDIEKQLLAELRQAYKTPEGTHDGYTECFLDIPREWLLQRVTQLCSNALTNKPIN